MARKPAGNFHRIKAESLPIKSKFESSPGLTR